MNIFSIQTQFDSAEALRYNREVQPTAVMGINVVKAEWWRKIKADNPHGLRIYRHHPDPRFDNYPMPEESAEKAVAALKAEIGHLLDEGLITHVTDGNEDIEAKHHDLHPLRDRYAAAFIRLARQELGVGTFWGNFFCGHFGDETVDLFPLALQAMEEDNREHPDNPSAITFHEYDWPTLDRIFAESGDYWLCGKFLKAMPPILEKFPRAKCAITEFGLDSLAAHVPGEHQGWRKTRPDLNVAIEMLCGERGLKWYYPLTEVPWLIAVLWFGCGLFGDWRGRGFDIMENEDDTAVMERVKRFAGWAPPLPPEEEEQPEEPMTDKIKVIDLEYKERDLAYAEAKYGVAFRRAEVEPGQKVYRLVELNEKTGDSSLITKVLGEDGSPRADVDVAFHWPDAPRQSINKNDWHVNFVHGKTNKNGDVGPGMGKGAYHGEGEGGPHAVWVRDPDIPTDICEKLGMLAGTFHDHLDQKFQLMVHQGEEPPPPPSPGEKVLQLKERLELDHEANMLGIAIDDDYAVANDARGDFRGPGLDAPPIHPRAWTHPVTEERMALMEGCPNFNQEFEGETRTYTMQVRNLKTSGWLTEEHPETFPSLESGVAFKRVVYVYELVEPPEPPPTGDLAAKVEAMLTAIANAKRETAAIDAALAAEMEKLMNG